MFPVLAGNSASTGYNLTRSLRFRASASAYLSRTPSVTGNNYTWTYSAWVKRGALGIDGALLWAGVQSSGFKNLVIKFDTSNTLTVYGYVDGGSTDINIQTTQVFRDPSAFYHIVVVIDTTQATSSNRVKIYVNGLQVTALAATTYPALNYITPVNEGRAHNIGRWLTTGSVYFDGYLTEVNFIDGQALTPSSFGSTNALTGVWQPARYAGTYGTNGFYLPFTDNSALTTSSNVGLGKDFSGNGNYWTTNNISITSGVTYDSMTDVPTLTSATAANYCVLNPLSNGAGTLSAGNLNHVVGGSITRCNSTIFASSGKWYFEVMLNTAGTNTSIGIGQNNITNQYPGQDILSFVQEIDNARKGNNDVYTSYGTALTAGQVFMCAVDLTNLKIFFGGQGSWFASSDPVAGTNPAFTLTAGLYCAISRPFGGSAAISINFGQRPFSYTPPTGFVALNTFNLPTSTILQGNKVMDATTYTGNGGTLAVTNAGAFKPDLVWIKQRNTTKDNQLQDSVRGVALSLQSNTTSAESNYGLISSLNSNGFTVFTNGTYTASNENGGTFVGWQWQAGQGSSSSNTNGTITSTVSVNASAGFSVVTYTVTTTPSMTIGHGLGVAPQLIIEKRRDGAANWDVYTAATGNTGRLILNSTSAFNVQAGVWNNTSPTSTVFSQQGNGGWHAVGSTCVAYCWTPIAGYSAFGGISANGAADNYFTYTGFLPRFVMLKRTDSTSNWIIWDTARNTYNVLGNELYPNLSNAEASAVDLDILSNGFKLRSASFSGTWIYAAFATTPFKNSLGF